MKKWLIILMAFAVLLGSAGCNDDPSYAPLVMIPGEVYTSYHGVEVQLDRLNWIEGNLDASLSVVWNNKTPYEVTYGASFAIERLDGEEWVNCAISDDLVFIAIGYLLPAGASRTETYTLTDRYDITSPGTYRFKTDCYVACSDKEIKCLLTAEFTLRSESSLPRPAGPGTENTVIFPFTDPPPKGVLITPEGKADLRTGGYHWIYNLGNGLESATIADQASRLPSKELLPPVTIPNPYAEITDTLGCPVQLEWEIPPASVTYACWQDTVWQNSSIPEETVINQGNFTFYAKPGSYIYEIVATWNDTGEGCQGKANYYVYIQF